MGSIAPVNYYGLERIFFSLQFMEGSGPCHLNSSQFVIAHPDNGPKQ